MEGARGEEKRHGEGDGKKAPRRCGYIIFETALATKDTKKDKGEKGIEGGTGEGGVLTRRKRRRGDAGMLSHFSTTCGRKAGRCDILSRQTDWQGKMRREEFCGWQRAERVINSI
jgi:hypothetical protein